jgi:diguanylate cyclase (GGDEF)-like protein
VSRRAWAYIWLVLLMGLALGAVAVSGLAPAEENWAAGAILMALAIITQLLDVESPGRQIYYPHLLCFFAGLLLLSPGLFVVLVAAPHLVEWAHKRLTGSPNLRNWYLQPFNIAAHIIAGIGAAQLYGVLSAGAATLFEGAAVTAALGAAAAYMLLNHILVGLALFFARGISWQQSKILGVDSLLGDFVVLLMGYTTAILWVSNPWLITLALAPLVTIQRALMVPGLKQAAALDSKTGLLNAQHFNRQLQAELDRARRFDHPLAVIMADLDLLREINNSYGHLAGDSVIIGLSRIIQEQTREYDLAGRFGGEEFALVLPETDLEAAMRFAERLRHTVEATPFLAPASDEIVRATVSLGVACFPEHGTTITELTHAADVALYEAKFRGRNCVMSVADLPPQPDEPCHLSVGAGQATEPR